MPLPQNVRETVAGNLHRLSKLLNHYTETKLGLPRRLILEPPWMLGEVGADVDGVIVNQDTVRQQATVATLWRLGVIDYLRHRAAENGTAHMIEIGAGHGSLCYHLKRIVPQLTYTIIDLPETLPRVNADAPLLERAVANVVDNARAWSPAARTRTRGARLGNILRAS